MRRITIAATLFFACTSVAVQADDGHIALIRTLSGHAHIVRDTIDLPATIGMPLMRSDKVVALEGSSVGMTFLDGTLLTLGAASEVDLQRYSFEPAEANYAFSVFLKKGSAIYSSGKLGKISPASVSVETPKAVIGVRGTRFVVRAD